VSERLDAADLHARLWYAEHRLQQHARRISPCLDLDPGLAQRLDAAAQRHEEAAIRVAARVASKP
jgi:hypothetical protein